MNPPPIWQTLHFDFQECRKSKFSFQVCLLCFLSFFFDRDRIVFSIWSQEKADFYEGGPAEWNRSGIYKKRENGKNGRKVSKGLKVSVYWDPGRLQKINPTFPSFLYVYSRVGEYIYTSSLFHYILPLSQIGPRPCQSLKETTLWTPIWPRCALPY